jgi:hypothetical protein
MLFIYPGMKILAESKLCKSYHYDQTPEDAFVAIRYYEATHMNVVHCGGFYSSDLINEEKVKMIVILQWNHCIDKSTAPSPRTHTTSDNSLCRSRNWSHCTISTRLGCVFLVMSFWSIITIGKGCILCYHVWGDTHEVIRSLAFPCVGLFRSL